MVGSSTRGFTIIEVMLFLGISSVLFVALMVGVSNNINQQRYRDSVASLVGVIQQQYSEVSNTRNDRDATWRCDASQVEQNVDSGQARGTSDCVLLGRYIRTIDSATKLEVGSVIGSEPAGDQVIEGDSAALAAFLPRASSFGQTTYTPEWGATLRNTDNQPASFTILILRSPQSGLIRTFATPLPMPSQLTDVMTPDSAAQKITTCVLADDWMVGLTRSVVIDATIAGPNGVSASGDTDEC